MRALVVWCLLCWVGRAAAAEPAIAFFSSPALALRELLARQPRPPRVLAFGEVHEQRNGPRAIPAIRRFSDEMIAALPCPAELIVETWVENDACGKIEHEVVAQVAHMTQRPASTETDIMRLLRLGKDAGLRPRILSLSCDTYRSLQTSDGSLDPVALLGAVTVALRKAILGRLSGSDPIVVYGGALHNDRRPRKALARFSFAHAVEQAARGRYLEVDLYVPEYVEHDPAITGTAWWPRYAQARAEHPGETALVLAQRGSYVILFQPTLVPRPLTPPNEAARAGSRDAGE